MSKKEGISALFGIFLLLGAFALIQISGCDGGGHHEGTATTGTLQASITDARAFPNYSSVHVNVLRVVAVPAGREDLSDNDAGLPVIATFPGGTDINILKLHFIPQILGSATVPAGSYSQIRLILSGNQPTLGNYVVFTDNPTQKVPLTTPSAKETGLKIVGKFTVTAGVVNTILIDFNPNTAIVRTGHSGALLKPTGIKLVQVFNTLNNAGAVTGEIRSPAFTKWSTATISVEPRNPAGAAIASGTVFSNFSSPSVWKAPFSLLLPPNQSGAMPAANYKVFVDAIGSGALANSTFRRYSSPLFTVTTGVDTPIPPGGTVLLSP